MQKSDNRVRSAKIVARTNWLGAVMGADASMAPTGESGACACAIFHKTALDTFSNTALCSVKNCMKNQTRRADVCSCRSGVGFCAGPNAKDNSPWIQIY